MNEKLNLEQRMLRISMLGNAIFIIAECLMAYITRSKSILMDCVFDLADLIMIGPFLLLIPLLYTPVTERRPYGYSQVEALFVIIKYCVLVVITGQLVLSSINTIIRGGNHVDAGIIAVFEVGVAFVCLLIYLMLRHYSKKYASPSIKADLFMWKMDIVSSLGVGLAFSFQLLLKDTSGAWLVPYIDPVAAILLAVFLIIEPVKMIIVGVKNLVLFAPDRTMMEDIRDIANKHLEKYPYKISFLDVIQTGRKAWVEIYLSSENDHISIEQLRAARSEIKIELRKNYDQIYVELIPEMSE